MQSFGCCGTGVLPQLRAGSIGSSPPPPHPILARWNRPSHVPSIPPPHSGTYSFSVLVLSRPCWSLLPDGRWSRRVLELPPGQFRSPVLAFAHREPSRFSQNSLWHQVEHQQTLGHGSPGKENVKGLRVPSGSVGSRLMTCSWPADCRGHGIH